MRRVSYLVFFGILDVNIAVQINGNLAGRIKNVGNRRFVDQLTVVVAHVCGEEYSSAMGIMGGDVSDDSRKPLNGMGSLDVALGWIVHVFGGHCDDEFGSVWANVIPGGPPFVVTKRILIKIRISE